LDYSTTDYRPQPPPWTSSANWTNYRHLNNNTAATMTPPNDAWTITKTNYLKDDDLSSEEKDMLNSCSLKDLIDEMKRMENRHAQDSKTRNIMSSLQPFAQTLRKIGPALDTFSNADPHGIMSLVWGSVRLILVVHSTRPRFSCVF